MDAREINKIIIHCSDSPDDMDIGVAKIDEWHKKRFDGVLVGETRVYCGYHYVIKRDGSIEIGRPEHYVGAHCKDHNKNSIGICWIGRDIISVQQMASLMNLLRVTCLKHGLNYTDVFGHTEFNSGKTCPNLNMNEIRVKLSQRIPGGLP